MIRVVDPLLFLPCPAAPQQIHDGLILLLQFINDFIGKPLPSQLLMGQRLPFFHRQDRIQQQYAILRPVLQIPVSGKRHLVLILQLLVHIPQGRWDLHPVIHRKRHPMRLALTMIGILPQDHHLHILLRGLLEGLENLPLRRIDLLRLVFPGQSPVQVIQILLFLLPLDQCIPAVVCDRHSPIIRT